MNGIFDYIKNEFSQLSQPVYNNLGRNIGHYITPQQLASGSIVVYQGEVAGDPAGWQIKCGVLGILRNAGECLVKSYGLTPAWYSEAQKQAAAANATPQAIPNGLFDFSKLNLTFPSFDNLSAPQDPSNPQLSFSTKFLLAGSAVAIAAILLTRKNA